MQSMLTANKKNKRTTLIKKKKKDGDRSPPAAVESDAKRLTPALAHDRLIIHLFMLEFCF